MTLVLILLGAVGMAVATYWWLERIGRRAWLAAAFRALAWSALGVLVLNLSCATRRAAGPPIALLDASLSYSGSARWTALRDSLSAVADVWYFGDQRPARDSSPRGTSRLGPALSAAAATSRSIVVYTDGELDDVQDIPADILARAHVNVLARKPEGDVALVRIRGPERVTQGDTLALEAEVLASPTSQVQRIGVVLGAGSLRLARASVDIEPGGRKRVQLRAPTNRLPAGEQLVTIALDGVVDSESRTDMRLHHVEIVPTPGVVILASPPDWDAKFLYRALKEVSDLPVRGYSRVTDGTWHGMHDLGLVSESVVRRAARRADLLILKGRDEGVGPGPGTKAVWRWPSGENGVTTLEGDWYVTPELGSPMSEAFLGLPVDSFPPATQVTPIDTGTGGWTALTAQAGRRGASRPIVTGIDAGRRRRLVVGADGFWRWAFRGGSSEQGYRSFVASAVTWLLGGADSARGPAVVVHAVVERGRPVVFRAAVRDSSSALPIHLSGPAGVRTDTLRWDGSGEAEVWLPPGEYRYHFGSGGPEHVIAVEEYSTEWLVRPTTLDSSAAGLSRQAGRASAREALWLFGLGILGLVGEWTVRRRLGLR